ncbi:hypothetical protein SBOR_10014 [Sclerotinia borealis F-4128]|uniref:Anaphase-promoting complex, subunit CDC26 n=1 Tax=Sclerotinia borealis (strain F-4128) TaxID=1432307 RepID=W9BYC9_SCLBF|nr:hypothetical protein SBOR_10014 [Sclerotinia borealis F-4128]
MLRRAPTSITLTTEDIAIYEDSRQAERNAEEDTRVKADAARRKKARERSEFGSIWGNNYREAQSLAAQIRVDNAREAHIGGGSGSGSGNGDGDGEGNTENELSEDEDVQMEREREERAREREREERARERDRSRVQEREARVQRSREDRLGLGGRRIG